jgi:hypothetical protein
MSTQGKNSLSYKKKNVQRQNTPAVGVKSISFAHEFVNAGEDAILYNTLNVPTAWAESGLSNPSGSELLAAQLNAFAKNVEVSSSARGYIQKSEYIVQSSGIFFKNITSLANEVFEVSVSDVLVSGNRLVDIKQINVDGELLDTTTDFNLGIAVDAFNEEVLVFREGLQMFRSDNNDSSGATGNFYYLDPDGSGKSSVIRFFEAADGDEPIKISGNIADDPNLSTFQEIQKLQGQIDSMIPTLAGLAGVPTTDFQSTPNNVDLKFFGDLLVSLSKDSGKVGDVKTSMLTEAQFQELHGQTWVLMDGRSVTGSTYETITGSSTIPDARGQFLRGKNNGRSDGQQNPDGDIALGTQTTDKFDSHNHGGGDHTHTALEWGNFNNPTSSAARNRIAASSNPRRNDVIIGDSGTIVNTEGGNETAPKNITINYFIKINS